MCVIKSLIESNSSPEQITDRLLEYYLSDLEQGAHQNRTERGDRVQVHFSKLNPKTHTASFKTRDPQGSGKYHQQDLRFSEFTDIGREDMPIEDRLELALGAGQVLVYCQCEDFRYKGFKFMGHIGDYGIRKETRPPNIMNPGLDGTVCKHLIGVIQDIDSFLPEIADAWREARSQDYRVVHRPLPPDPD